MAEGKKSFTAYCDWGKVLDKMTDEQAGKLMKHLFDYVRDKNPETDDLLIDVAFTPIQDTLKRDLIKWEEKCNQNKVNGKKGGRPSNAEKPNGLENNPEKPNGYLEKPKKADSDSDSDSDSVNETNTKKSVGEIEVDLSGGEGGFKDSLLSDLKKAYDTTEFLTDWNSLRLKHLKKVSHINRIGNNEDLSNFKDLKKDYARDDFKNAMVGLFKQKKLPNGNTSMQSNPSHFLKYFNSYLTAFHDQNDSLYGKKVIETL